jgi:molybdenum cofactor sulfurtransferase
VIFVANATAAIKLVMHSFQDCATEQISGPEGSFWYGYHGDAHTSLVGIRQVTQGSTRCFKSDIEVEDWIQNKVDIKYGRRKKSRLGLFAYQAQSNMNGHRLPLNWPGRIRASRHAIHQNIYTLLDAAAYATTAQIDLSNPESSPDFTALSFYKIFGFPDLGALVVRKAAGHILRQRRYFGGGTVEMVIALDAAWHATKSHTLHDALEDGTLPFHNIIALDSALDTHELIFGSMERITAHCAYLAKVLHAKLSSLRHSNGRLVCTIYKHPDSAYGDSKTQGPTIAFNVCDSTGAWVGKSFFEELAIGHGIQLRTSGVCNLGGIATYLDLQAADMRTMYAEGMRCGNDFDIWNGKPTGIVRVSLGAMSNLKDIETLICFIRDVFVDAESPLPGVYGHNEHSKMRLASQEATTCYVRRFWIRGGVRVL